MNQSSGKDAISLGRPAQLIRWDNHVCLPFGGDRRKFFSELKRHRASGFNIASVNIGYANCTWEDHIGFATELTAWLNDHHDSFTLIRRANDVRRARETNRLGVFFDVEGGNLLQGDVRRVQELYDCGVRWMCLTYNMTNSLVGGCSPAAVDNGLTDLGRSVVREMNRVGMIVCCSHTGKTSVLDIIEHSERPVIFSHSNSISLHDHWRNIDDDVALSCARNGGVVCVNGVAPFLDNPPYKNLVENLVEQVVYFVELLGFDHVGIGLDYVYDQSDLNEVVKSQKELFVGSEASPPVFDFVPPEALADLENGLLARGLGLNDIDKVLGGNLARIALQCWN
jgi:membrane dipeptidase